MDFIKNQPEAFMRRMVMWSNVAVPRWPVLEVLLSERS